MIYSNIAYLRHYSYTSCAFCLLVRKVKVLINLLSEGASLCKTCLTAGWLAEHDITIPTQDDGLCMAEDCGNLKASWALDIHEV